VHPDVEELRPRLKEVLYDCAVDIRATKAALYVFDGSARFELVTEYGFRGGIRGAADLDDPLVDRCNRARSPFFVNGLAAEPRLAEIMFESSTDRLLVAPLYSRGKLIGLIDMRDKAGKQPFETVDVPKAQQIADRLVELLGDKHIFGQRYIQLSNVTTQHPAIRLEDMVQARSTQTSPAPAPPAEPEPPAPSAVASAPLPAPATAQPAAAPAAAPPAPRAAVPGLASLVLEARTAMSRIAVASAPPTIGEAELNAARDVLRSILLIPGAVAATFSAYGHMGGVQEIAARSSVGEDARNLIQSKLTLWLQKRGDAGGYVRTSVLTPFGTTAPPVTAADIQKVFTAPLAAGNARGLYLTVVFGGNPDRVAHELLAVLHSHMQLVLEQSLQRGSLSALQWRVAEKLLEPDFTRYPELRHHSDQVVGLAESFARHLALSPQEVEQARLLALVHDAGLRLLDYARLYRKRDLTPEEMSFLREHPAVGAAMIEPLLGADIARAVLAHHERMDGRGYPNGLHGDEIPYLARVLQLCDAWVAMTDPESYQAPAPREAALATMTNAAGGQFDAELTTRFVEMIRSTS
jgi:hypothetical protein